MFCPEILVKAVCSAPPYIAGGVEGGYAGVEAGHWYWQTGTASYFSRRIKTAHAGHQSLSSSLLCDDEEARAVLC